MQARPAVWLIFLSAIFRGPAIQAQTLHLSSVHASPGVEVSINLSLAWRRGHETPSALQWNITIPAPKTRLMEGSPGPQAQTAGKGLACREQSRTAATQTFTCLLYGGREPIRSGGVGVFRLQIAPGAPPGPARIRIDQAIAVRKDATKVGMKPTEAVVQIRRK